jgi:putative ABC transport system permease protein
MNLAAARRIARADLAGRPVQTALTALAIFAAATALVVTLTLRSGLDDPFAAAQQATKGSHVTIYGDGDLSSLTRLPGVVASDERPRVDALTTLTGSAVNLGVEAMPGPAAAVDVPRVTEGRRPAAADEALLERSFARESGLRVGDTLHVERHDRAADLRITGVAVTTEQATYPR